MTEIHERIEMIINSLGMNKNSFAKRIGVSNTAIENIVGRRQSKPGFEILSRVVESFENINPEWLLTGKGEMLNGRTSDEHNSIVMTTLKNKPVYKAQFSELEEQVKNKEKEIEMLRELLKSKEEMIALLKSMLEKRP